MNSATKREWRLLTIGDAGDVVKTELIVSTTLLEGGMVNLLVKEASSMQLRSATMLAISPITANSEEKNGQENCSTKPTITFSDWDEL